MLLVFLLLHGKTKAQEDGKEQKIKRYEWEVATNVMPLLFDNNRSPYSSFVRKNFIKLRNKRLIKRAYRIGVDFDSRVNSNLTLNYANAPLFSPLIDNFGDFTYISSRLGYEWQFHLQKFHFYYGYEIYGTYRSEFFDSTNSLTLLQGIIYRKSDAFSLGLRGLGGVKYFIHPRFAISAETGLFFEHFKEKATSKWRESSNVPLEYSHQRDMNIMQYIPLMNINLSILF